MRHDNGRLEQKLDIDSSFGNTLYETSFEFRTTVVTQNREKKCSNADNR